MNEIFDIYGGYTNLCVMTYSIYHCMYCHHTRCRGLNTVRNFELYTELEIPGLNRADHLLFSTQKFELSISVATITNHS